MVEQQKYFYYSRHKTNRNYNNSEEYRLHNNYYELLMKRLNSRSREEQDNAILGEEGLVFRNTSEIIYPEVEPTKSSENITIELYKRQNRPRNLFEALGIKIEDERDQGEIPDNNDDENDNGWSNANQDTGAYAKSKNFEVIKKSPFNFQHVGGYDNVKEEMIQCIDILKNYRAYKKYNVRTPKGLVLEGPPGTGKTLLAKAFAGEAKCSFIAVAGSDFQEKYVGVGPSRIKELFKLAKENEPSIIFIDEIDALGRKRSSDGESSSSERDNTLNALLVELDGFKNNTGIFIIAATNRIDLLDSALLRPGRIDKKIYIGLPDKKTREIIVDIHIRGKPHDDTVKKAYLIEVTEGLSGAQIENLLNEAMLNALRNKKTEFSFEDIDLVMNKMIAGWQPNEHQFTTDIIDHIAIHEMGHAVVGLLSEHHSKVSKVVINLSSPKSPGYTVFESSTSNIYVREALFEHLMILLSGRIAEEVFYNVSVTTGAINDFDEALKLAEKMVVYYGMGNSIIYPHNSEKYKEMIDNDVIELINEAYDSANLIIQTFKDFVHETSELLKKEKIIRSDELVDIFNRKYKRLLDD
jgi:ATP-dependent metalloprotease FtsH